jgi:uncharacterized protein YegL
VDESGSIGQTSFNNMKAFINDVVDELETKLSGDVRYALTMFDQYVDTKFHLGENNYSLNPNDFKSFVSSLPKDGGLTCTAGALQGAFSANFGPLLGNGKVDPSNTNLRSGVATVMFVLTDGNPTARPDGTTCDNPNGDCQCLSGEDPETSPDVYQAIKASATADFPNKVVALGVGSGVDASFLASMSDQYLDVANFSPASLDAVIDEVTGSIVCRPGTRSPTKTPVVAPTKWPTKSPSSCANDLDLIFIVDESGSIDWLEFANMKTFIKDIVDDLEAEVSGSIRYALTMFDDKVDTKFYLGKNGYSTYATNFKNYITNLSRGAGWTCTAGALQGAFSANFGPLLGNGKVDPNNTHLRSGVPTVMFMITDGNPTAVPNANTCVNSNGDCQCLITSTPETSPQVYAAIKASETADFPNKVVALGVGNGVNASFLQSLSDKYLDVADFTPSKLAAVRQQILDLLVCT